MTEIYFAPMEGVTTRTYRRVFREFYSGVDRFYSPFIVVTGDMAFKKRDRKGVLPYEEGLIPQLLTNDPAAFVWGAKSLAGAGYRTVNLNAGCPVGTVVNKKKGAGLLKEPSFLDRFLEDIFSSEMGCGISIKVRAGFYDTQEAGKVADILARYPFEEVIIHPRAREDYYNGKPDMEAFDIMRERISCPVCYNGDLRTVFDVRGVCTQREGVSRIMIGRGLIADPALGEKIKADMVDTVKEKALEKEGVSGEFDDNKRLGMFLDRLKEEYLAELSGERDVLFKMKEIISHVGVRFPKSEQALKTIRKTVSLTQYEVAVKNMLGI